MAKIEAPKTVDCAACQLVAVDGGDWCWTCGGQGFLWCCAGCGDPITGCIWNGGRCLDCHEGSLLPETALDRWDAEYAL